MTVIDFAKYQETRAKTLETDAPETKPRRNMPLVSELTAEELQNIG